MAKKNADGFRIRSTAGSDVTDVDEARPITVNPGLSVPVGDGNYSRHDVQVLSYHTGPLRFGSARGEECFVYYYEPKKNDQEPRDSDIKYGGKTYELVASVSPSQISQQAEERIADYYNRSGGRREGADNLPHYEEPDDYGDFDNDSDDDLRSNFDLGLDLDLD